MLLQHAALAALSHRVLVLPPFIQPPEHRERGAAEDPVAPDELFNLSTLALTRALPVWSHVQLQRAVDASWRRAKCLVMCWWRCVGGRRRVVVVVVVVERVAGGVLVRREVRRGKGDAA